MGVESKYQAYEKLMEVWKIYENDFTILNYYMPGLDVWFCKLQNIDSDLNLEDNIIYIGNLNIINYELTKLNLFEMDKPSSFHIPFYLIDAICYYKISRSELYNSNKKQVKYLVEEVVNMVFSFIYSQNREDLYKKFDVEYMDVKYKPYEGTICKGKDTYVHLGSVYNFLHNDGFLNTVYNTINFLFGIMMTIWKVCVWYGYWFEWWFTKSMYNLILGLCSDGDSLHIKNVNYEKGAGEYDIVKLSLLQDTNENIRRLWNKKGSKRWHFLSILYVIIGLYVWTAMYCVNLHLYLYLMQ